MKEHLTIKWFDNLFSSKSTLKPIKHIQVIKSYLINVDTNWKVRRILIEKSSIHNWLQNYYKFKIFIYLVSFFVFP